MASALLLRAQRRAVYLPHNEGHYALGAGPTATSPRPSGAIRTFWSTAPSGAALRPRWGREMRAQAAALPQLCLTCSERERAADAAERASQKIKMAELFSERVGERFAGTVSGCERFGLFVTLDETYAEGCFHQGTGGRVVHL